MHMKPPTQHASNRNRLKAVETLSDSPLPAASPWMGRHELAKFFKVSVRTVDGWTAQNLVPFRRLGRRIIFRIEQVEASLAAYDVTAKR